MTSPDIRVEIAWQAGPGDPAPVWSDITQYITDFSVKRGRGMELDEPESGTLSVILDNSDGRFTPGRVASPHYPFVTPRRPVRITALNPFPYTFNGSLVKVGTGTVSWSGSAWTVATVGATDTFVHPAAAQPFSRASVGPVDVSVVWQTLTEGAGSQGLISASWYDSAGAFLSTVKVLTAWQVTSSPGGATARISPAMAPLNAAFLRVGVGVEGNRQPVRILSATVTAAPVAVGFGIVERWPVRNSAGGSEAVLTLTDNSVLMAEKMFPNSDTGGIEAAAPTHWFTFDGTLDDGTWPDTAPGARAGVFARMVNGNGAPVNWSSDGASLLPSGAGQSVDIGARINEPSSMRGWMVDASSASSLFGRAHTAESFTFCTYFSLTQYEPDGTTILHATDPAGVDLMHFYVTGTSAEGADPGRLAGILPAGYMGGIFAVFFDAVRIIPGVKYFLVVSQDGPAGRVYAHLFTESTSVSAWKPYGLAGAVPVSTARALRLGGLLLKGAFGFKGHFRFAHFAVFNRFVGEVEARSLFGGWLTQPGMTETQRIERLSTVATPTGPLHLDSGLSPLNRDSWTSNTSALSLARRWAKSAGGYVFHDAAGRFVYHNRHRRYTAPAGPVFSTDDGTGVEAGFEFEADITDVRNVIDLNVLYGIKARLKDEASIAQYGERSHTLELDVQSSGEGMDAAALMLSRYAVPVARLNFVTLNPTAHGTGALWAPCLALEIGDRITLSGLGDHMPASSMPFFVESVEHRVSVRNGAPNWATTLGLSPGFGTDAWILGSATRGALDQTAMVVY